MNIKRLLMFVKLYVQGLRCPGLNSPGSGYWGRVQNPSGSWDVGQLVALTGFETTRTEPEESPHGDGERDSAGAASLRHVDQPAHRLGTGGG